MTRWRTGCDQQALTPSYTKPRGLKSTDKASADPRTPLYPKAEGLGRRSSRRNSRHTRNGSGTVGMVGADSLSQPPGAIRLLSPGVIRPLSRHSVILGRISSWGNMVSRMTIQITVINPSSASSGCCSSSDFIVGTSLPRVHR